MDSTNRNFFMDVKPATKIKIKSRNKADRKHIKTQRIQSRTKDLKKEKEETDPKMFS
jgi:hypothetical protein